MGMLKGHVKIWQDLAPRRHDVNQAIRHISGKCIHDADPGHVRHGLGQFFEQDRQAILQAKVMAVVRCILCDQDELADALVAQHTSFLQDARQRAAHSRTLD